MLSYGEPPYLECSSKGDKRFSAFYAIIDDISIEERYQAFKVLEDGTSGNKWRYAKGKKAVNQEACNVYYSELWNLYIVLNPDLLKVLKEASGVSDLFGQQGHCCQATELWRIRNELA